MRWVLFGLAALVCYWVVNLVIAAVISIPKARELSVMSACQENLSAIGRAMAAYTQDWDGRLPPADRWSDAIYPKYLKWEGNFACKAARGRYGYSMNSKLSGARLDEIQNADRVPLVFETTKSQPNAHDPVTSRRRDGPHRAWGPDDVAVRGSGVLFAHLRARMVPDDEELSP